MLEILGAAFAVVLGCMIVGGLFGVVWVKDKVRDASVVDALRDSLNGIKPAQLEKADDCDWHHPLEAELICGEFLESGLQSIGFYTIPEIDDIVMQAFMQQQPPVYVTVNDHPKYGCWTDIVMLPRKGGSVTLTNVAAGSVSIPRPPQHELEKLHVSTHPVSMLGYVRSRALDGEFETVSADRFQRVFNNIMSECQLALAHQDIDQEWLQNVARDSGITLSGDEAEAINAERQVERHEYTVSQCLSRYAKSTGMSAQEWEQSRAQLLVIYENMPDWLLIEQLYDRLPVPQELEAELADIEKDDRTTRVCARRFIESLPDPDAAEHLVTLSEPVMADIYRVSSVQDTEYRKAA